MAEQEEDDFQALKEVVLWKQYLTGKWQPDFFDVLKVHRPCESFSCSFTGCEANFAGSVQCLGDAETATFRGSKCKKEYQALLGTPVSPAIKFAGKQ